IFAQVGHFYFGEVGQYYFGANKISNSRHSTAIFSPSSNRATNLSRSSIGRHSRHGICVPPANAGKCQAVSTGQRNTSANLAWEVFRHDGTTLSGYGHAARRTVASI